jgi:hypothetical protein
MFVEFIMSDVKYAFESPESQPTRPARETINVPFMGAFSVGDDRTVFLCQFKIVTPEAPKGLSFGQSTFLKVLAVLEADAAAQGGVCKPIPQTPMINTRVQTTSGREISNGGFINRILKVAEMCGLKFKERVVQQVPQAPAGDQGVPNDNVPF